MPDHLDRFIDRLDLETDREDVQLDRTQLRQLSTIKRLIYRETEKIMALVDDLKAAQDKEGADATAANDRVIASLGNLGTQISDLQAQVAALQSAGSATPEQLQALLDAANAADATINSIDPAAPPPPPAP